MAMNIADYLIVRDRVAGNDGQIHTPPADLKLPDDEVDGDGFGLKVFRFELPAHAVTNERALLAYMLDPVPLSGEVDVEYEIRLNDVHITRIRIESTMMRGMWDQVPGNVLWERSTDQVVVPRENNLLEFRLVNRRSNGGHLRFFNIVLWFQRTVPGG